MTYQEILDFLYSQLPAYHRVGIPAYKTDLGNTIRLDEYFGHPHRNFRSVHIAGTNGKGSVSHMLASVLMSAGYKTGLYTSPHLRDFRERIRVNGEMIPKDEVIRFVAENREIIERIKPSFFEMTVALAFNYFASAGVSVAVIETGLGGRLDSTNIITPVLSVITNIGHDHMDILGDSLAKVAGEKAGIIKPGVPVIIGETFPDSEKVFASAAEAAGSEIIFTENEIRCIPGHFAHESVTRDFFIESFRTGEKYKIVSPLAGDYQAKNIPVVWVSSEILKKEFDISNDNIIEGIEEVIRNTGLAGRWQVIGHKPLVICDTGHNKEGLEIVLGQLLGIPAPMKHFVIGFVSDKDISAILPLFPAGAKYYFTRASVTRAMDEKVLKEKAGRFGLTGESYGSVKEALEKAKASACSDDLIFVGGSTFVVAEVV